MIAAHHHHQLTTHYHWFRTRPGDGMMIDLLFAVHRFTEEHRHGHVASAVRPDRALADRYPPNLIMSGLYWLEQSAYIESGPSLATAWLTEKGITTLRDAYPDLSVSAYAASPGGIA